MKTLMLLRHAKSGRDDRVVRDVDRPLNREGHRAAQLVGRYLKRQGLAFDRVVASPAVRVKETLIEVEAGYGTALIPVWDRRVYLATAETLLEIVREQPDAAARVLLVGHSPGLEDLLLLLVPAAANGMRDAVEHQYPTAGIAELTLAVDDWGAVAPGGATLIRFVRPRDLDPTPGRDAG